MKRPDHYRIARCPKCHRKRWIWSPIGSETEYKDGFEYYWVTCSKGHLWRKFRMGLELINSTLKTIYLPALERLFNKPSILWERLHK